MSQTQQQDATDSNQNLKQCEDVYDEETDVVYFQRRFDKSAVNNLFRTSVMMFTLPFISFFAARNFVREWGIVSDDDVGKYSFI